ncbi:MAG TPA: diacylglycerol kinase [Nocardioides sp.]|uniref:NAD(P)H-dependent amine dehydrogenase family protein n=1 Tax=uncultured Nocardioides sp. TaxID=198441 RepID=UPI000EB9DE08|nr:diacylglycerol kinase [uncultured Nocardioides sp.]HCB04350.1 diacylglycerol kinase [Nocardioides sp.]HRI96720.1 diacylglycerol kinase [Nocardioides sp.]HRK46113.1 diacylglycerol kinase [Nocardioides sp.]
MGQVIPEKPLRVVVWSTGTIGRHAIAGVDAHPDLELVGVWTSTSAKEGRDAGELAELGRELGIRATTDRDALIALAPDAIVHTAMADDRVFECIDDLVSFVEAGINVTSSGPVLLQWPEQILPPEMIARIEDACVRGAASLHVNGIDPGFANDVLPLVMTSLSRRIDEVRVMEICDYSTYYQPVVMNELFGFGKPMDEVGMIFHPGILTMAWGSVVRQLAAGLDVTLDEPLTEEVDRRPAEWDTDNVSSGTVRKGTMGAVKFAVVGKVDGVPRVVLEHITRTDPEQVPEWERPPAGADGCYRIRITGEPTMNVDFTHHGEHGDHNVSGMITTAQRIINALPAVVAAEPGIVRAVDLPLVTGRGLVSR